MRGDLDLKAVLRNGIVHVESTGQKSVVRKAADVLDWLSNTLVMNLVSGIGTAYDILGGNAVMPWIKTFEVGIEDLFSAGARGWRRSRGLSVPQSNSSKFLGRIGMFFYDLPNASKDAWDYFWRNKPVEEIPFQFAGGKDELCLLYTSDAADE